MVKNTIVGICCLWLSLPVFGEDIDALKQQSREAVKALGEELKSTLLSSLQKDGPVESLSVCKLKAPEISKRVSDDKKMHVARTSLKVRNSDNVADEWEKPVLELFDLSKASGEDIDKIEYAEIMKDGDGRVFRYMKAIPTGEVCLTCHGDKLSPELSEKLHSLYPNDQATGYHKGDLRGAFTATMKLDKGK